MPVMDMGMDMVMVMVMAMAMGIAIVMVTVMAMDLVTIKRTNYVLNEKSFLSAQERRVYNNALA